MDMFSMAGGRERGLNHVLSNIAQSGVFKFGNVSYHDILLAFNATLSVLMIIKIDETLIQVDLITL
jgi:hypothetical protein